MVVTGLDWESSGSERVRAEDEATDSWLVEAEVIEEVGASTPHNPGSCDKSGSETGTCISGCCTLIGGGLLCCSTVWVLRR